MPVNINGHFYKGKNVENKLVVGNKYRIKLGDCKRYKNNKFCKGLSSYRSVRNDTTSCVGNILSNNKNVLDSCNWEKISVMDDWFINIEGIYYYSINRTMVLELLCLENKENDRIILSCLGIVRIK